MTSNSQAYPLINLDQNNRNYNTNSNANNNQNQELAYPVPSINQDDAENTGRQRPEIILPDSIKVILIGAAIFCLLVFIAILIIK